MPEDLINLWNEFLDALIECRSSLHDQLHDQFGSLS